MSHRAHVTDDRLVEVCFDGVPTPVEEAHFAACDRCRERLARLEHMLRELSDAAAVETDAIFPETRLAAQRVRILQRIEQDGRPARVIAFPAGHASDVRPLRAHPAARWIAGAAAAGLAVGLLAGHLAHDLPTAGRPTRTASRRSAPPPAAQPAIRAVSASLSDEQLLGEIELAIQGPALDVLHPLNELTPLP